MRYAKFLLLGLMIIVGFAINAQTPVINQIEYFFDADPGFGNGISIAVSADSVTSTTFDIDISGLELGFHKAYFRTKSENGAWSLSYFRNVFVLDVTTADTISDIVATEYFFDTDPGFGNGVAIAISADTITNTAFNIDIFGLEPGFHKAYFRTKSENGAWSLSYFRNVFVMDGTTADTISDIVAMEYFFDTDPGFGNGMAIAVSADTITNTTFDIDISALDAGFHKVYFRVKDETGKWSLSLVEQVFRVIYGPAVDKPDIIAMEYFIDTDPGFGNGTNVSVNADPVVGLTFNVDISGSSSGEHILYVRTMDENNNWSLINVSPFEISEVELKAYLEGSWNGSEMNTTLNAGNIIPLNQPFNVAPWNYTGTESVDSIPNPDVVDWVLLETRDADSASAATTETMSSRFAAFILNDGSIVDLDGTSNLKFNAQSDTNNFVVIRHRNHLGILSSSDLDYSSGVFSYDFTSSADKAFNSGQKNLGNGAYGMPGGDANGDGEVNESDKTLWGNQAGTTGYKSADLNMDGQANNPDKNDLIVPNNNLQSQVPD